MKSYFFYTHIILNKFKFLAIKQFKVIFYDGSRWQMQPQQVLYIQHTSYDSIVNEIF